MKPYYGRAKKGEKLFSKGYLMKRIYSCLMTIDIHGKKIYKLYNGSIGSKELGEFITENKKYFINKTILMDNAPFHKSKNIKLLTEQLNMQIIYTIPYSPELNPIEECFSKVKHLVRKCRKVSYNSIKKAISKLSLDNIVNYYDHAFN